MAWASPIQILHKSVFDTLLMRYMMELVFRWKQISPVQNTPLLFVTLFSLTVCWGKGIRAVFSTSGGHVCLGRVLGFSVMVILGGGSKGVFILKLTTTDGIAQLYSSYLWVCSQSDLSPAHLGGLAARFPLHSVWPRHCWGFPDLLR